MCCAIAPAIELERCRAITIQLIGKQSVPQRFSDGVGVFSDGLCVEVSVLISLPVAFPFSIPVGPGDDGRGLCVELVLPIPSAVGSTPPLLLV